MATLLDLDQLRRSLIEVADASQAPRMATYMKDRYRFLGVKSPERRSAARATMRAARETSPDKLIKFAEDCWMQPEREFQYVASDLLSGNVNRLRATDLTAVEQLIVTKSWWDTVDALASQTVGGLVAANPDLAAVMDEWIDSENLWLARTAILHQLKYGEKTDNDRLFRYSLTRAGDTEFFIRKAIGWALRQYARADPDAVYAFVDQHADEFSGLTKREALKHAHR
jgi:3-methyladenine DNA glycosylase AlkD